MDDMKFELLMNELKRQANGLDRLNDKMDEHVKGVSDWRLSVSEEFSTVKQDISALQVKSGVWGTIAGVLAAIGTLVMKAVTFGD